MALVSQPIPSLFNGVSQQAAALRSASQVEEQENFYPDLALGLTKRAPTEHVARLYATAPDPLPFTHFINRDANERYVVCVAPSGVKVFGLDGVERAVTLETSLGAITAGDPRDDLRALTVADTTFLASVRNTPGIASGSGEAGKPYAQVSYSDFDVSPITYGGYGYILSVTFNGVTKTANARSGDPSFPSPRLITVNQAIADLRAQFQAAFPTWTITNPSTRTISFIAPTTATPVPTCSQSIKYWTLSSGGAYSETNVSHLGTASAGSSSAAAALAGTKQKYSELPTTGLTVGQVWKIQGEPEANVSEYWVRWDGTVWVETFEPGNEATFTDTSLPLTLIRAGTGGFILRTAPWEKRKVGNNRTNPIPSFVGKPIAGMFYFRGRLGLIAGENIVMSRTTNPYDFWAESTTQVLDTDPVDVEVTSGRIAPLRHAIPFDKALMLFSDQSQMQLTAGDLLTPKTARVDPVTDYEASPLATPATIGQSLYYASDAGDYSVVREYFVTDEAVATDAANLTAHVPSYVPKNIRRIAACTQFDALLALSDEAPGEAYLYKFYWGQQEKLQSSWSRLTFGADAHVLDATFIGSVCYLVIRRGTEVFLEKMDFQGELKEPGMDFRVLLDRRVTVTGSYNAGTGRTSWTLPYLAPTAVAALGPAFGDLAGTRLDTSATTAGGVTVLSAAGQWTDGHAIVGVPYSARVRLSEQYVRDAKGNSILGGVLKLRRLGVSLKDTGQLRADITPYRRPARSINLRDRVASRAEVGANLWSGTVAVPVMSAASEVTIDLINDSHYPCRIVSGEWDGEYIQKAQRL